MNRHRQGGRDRRNYGGGDGNDFEARAMGAMVDIMSGCMKTMQLLQPRQGMGCGGGIGSSGMRNDRRRLGGQGREMDLKRRRRDSSGRGGERDRSRSHDSNRSQGRDRNHSSRWDSDRDRGRKVEDYVPAEATEDEKDKDRKQTCHLCNVSVYNDESFRQHLNGTKHNQRMLMKNHQLNKVEHLREIEGKGKSKRDGYDPNYFCKICNISLTIPWKRHKLLSSHKHIQLKVERGCGWCNVNHFNSFTELLEHRETEEHKKNAEQYYKRKDEKEHVRCRSRERRTEKSLVETKLQESDIRQSESTSSQELSELKNIDKKVKKFGCVSNGLLHAYFRKRGHDPNNTNMGHV